MYFGHDLPAMSSGMHIRPVLNLHGFMRRLYESPKFSLNVILRSGNVAHTVNHWVIRFEHIYLGVGRGVGLKPQLPKCQISSLKTRETVFFTFIKTEVISGTKEARVAEPLPFWDNSQRRVEAEHMKAWKVCEVGRRSTDARYTQLTTITTIAK
jgi:hypothetical protein